MGATLEKEIAELAALANASAAPEEFRSGALRRLQRLLGFDVGIIFDPPEAPDAEGTIVGFDVGFWSHLLADVERIAPEVQPLIQAAASHQGVCLDTDVYDRATRSRLAFYSEIISPIGARQFVTLVLPRRGRPPAIAQVGRTGRCGGDFSWRELQAARRLVPILSLAESAVVKTPTGPPSAVQESLDSLSAREREVANLMGRGLQNKEIAALLGTSVSTVRKQSIRVFAKLGTEGRVAAALLIQRSRA